jgi:hypothetical protein
LTQPVSSGVHSKLTIKPGAIITYKFCLAPVLCFVFISRSGDKWRVEDIPIPYQWELAAKMAMQNDRPDWAKWLKTGRA